MNIFVLSRDPVLAAQYMCDKHVVKMIVESAQILCTVVKSFGIEAPYKATHRNHPCTLWAGRSVENFDWLLRHSFALCDEYTYRYDKVHKTSEVIRWVSENVPQLPSNGLTGFVQAMPEVHKHSDPVVAYRNYYLGEKRKIAKWNKARQEPDWWKQGYVLSDQK